MNSVGRITAGGAIGLLALAAGCHDHVNGVASTTLSPSTMTSDSPAPATTQAAAQQTFDTPELAAAAFKQAVDMKDRAALLSIFGPSGRALVFSGDTVQEDNQLDSFAQHLGEQLRIDKPNPTTAVLYIGMFNWPFPIPLVSDGSQWRFDTDAGREEILNRRIGRNEFSAIDTCRAFLRAEKEYASKPRTEDQVIQFARKFGSSPGKHDGLYWDSTGPSDFSPLGDVLAQAEAEGYGDSPIKHRQPYHGYIFHILTGQGAAANGGAQTYLDHDRMIKGFAMIAYPVEWGNSGVMTFIINQDGKIFQKDLGADTSKIAHDIREFNPDTGWTEVKD